MTTSFAEGNADARAVALQPDGKIVAAGVVGEDFALARYNPDGSLDTSFDADGRVTTSVGNVNLDVVHAVAIQPDGKIVAAGTMGFVALSLARYNPDGSLDASFDGDGIVTMAFSAFDQAFAVALQPDGKIVAAGGGLVFGLARFNNDGSLDTSFDGDGIVTTDFNVAAFDSASALAIQADGKIVAAGHGSFGSGGDDDFALARYNPDGSLDTGFGVSGKATTDFGGGSVSSVCDLDQARDIAIQPDGKIVAAGVTGFRSFCSAFALARYNANGTPDTSFDGDGRVTTAVGQDGTANGLALQSNGKIVAAGFSSPGGFCCSFVLGRYLQDGTLDNSFGSGGKVATQIGAAFDLALQTDSKIVAAGATGFAFALARYLGDPSTPTCNGKPATIVGPAGDSTVNGTPGDDVIVDLMGNNKIRAAGGNDTICSGPDNDAVNGGGGNDWVNAGDGTNSAEGNAGHDTIITGSGNDELEGNGGRDSLTGGAGPDKFRGGDGTDTATDFKPAEGDTKTSVEVVL